VKAAAVALVAVTAACGRIGFDPAVPEELDPSLIGWWRFDENGPLALDSSPYGNHGVPTGGPSRVDGVIGGAFEFDGVDDYIDVPNSPAFTVREEMTVALWVRPTTDVPDRRLFASYGAWYIKLNGTHPQLTIEPVPYSIAKLSLPTGSWSHVAITFDRGDVRFYIDGARVIAGTDTFAGGELLVPGTGIHLGANDPDGASVQGALDDIRFYDRALGASEIAALAD
jgi:concanavalin A-like lectin/glucanase superfamily protein